MNTNAVKPVPTLAEFTPSEPLTLGVELELQLVNQHDYDLTPAAPDLLRLLARQPLRGQILPEMTDSMLELNTGPCASHDELLARLLETRDTLLRAADRLGVGVCGGGTHPFQNWAERRISRQPGFHQLSDLYGYLSKQSAVFGQHVHVGCADAASALRVLHGLSRYVPHLIALAAASPYLQGVDTGFDSARSNAIVAFPLTGRAPLVGSWAELTAYFDKLASTGIVRSLRDFFWDVRPSPVLGTVELRATDTPLTVEKAAALAGVVQCLARWLVLEQPFEPCEQDQLAYTYNRFQACRFGLDGLFVDPAGGRPRPLRDDTDALFARLEPHAHALGAQNALRLLRAELSGDGNDAAWLRRVQGDERLLPELVRRQTLRWAGR